MSHILTVGIAGAGAMGRGIAQVAATAGCKVYLYDAFPKALRTAEEHLSRIMARLVQKQKISQETANQIQARITYTETLDPLSEANLVIEAIIERLDIKQMLYGQIEEVIPADCILASNTSSLSIASLASVCQKPERFVGIHFFNPAPLMKLVEIIPAVQSDPAVVNRAQEIIDSWKKETVRTKDTPGFIVNRVARPFYGEALRMLEEGVADEATLDWAMTELGGFRMGPFTLMDYIGHDVNYAVTESVFQAFYYDDRYKPSFTQKRLAEAGFLGRKSGRGFYDYREGATKPQPQRNTELGNKILSRIRIMLINEAADALFLHIASRDDIDRAMTLGVNYPKGLLAWADELGIENCVAELDALFAEYHETRYRCSPLLRKMAREGKTFWG